MLEILENLNFVYKPFIALALSGLLLFPHSSKFKFLLNRNTVYLTMMLPVITERIFVHYILPLKFIIDFFYLFFYAIGIPK